MRSVASAATTFALAYNTSTFELTMPTDSLPAPAFSPNTAQTNVVVGGGNIIWSMPTQGSAYKKVVIYFFNATGSINITFTVPFTILPVVMTTSGLTSAPVSALTTTGCTLTGAGTTGVLFIEGY